MSALLSPPAALSACALIPTFDNPETVAAVVREAREHLPVVLVDDGSGPRAQSVLEGLVREAGPHPLVLIRHPENRGKGAALRTGFGRARQLGYGHALSLDADGQHLPGDIPAVLEAARRDPGALVLGARDLRAAGAGWGSRIGRWLSNRWLRLVGGPALPDTQTGLRVYPLAAVAEFGLRGERYELEVEVLARAAWRGVPLRSVPIRVRYFPRRERVSHMGVGAMLRVGRAWLQLWRERRGSR